MSKHLFTAVSGSGWRTSVSIEEDGRIEFSAGSGRVVTLTIKDLRKAVREYNRAIKEQRQLEGER